MLPGQDSMPWDQPLDQGLTISSCYLGLGSCPSSINIDSDS